MLLGGVVLYGVGVLCTWELTRSWSEKEELRFADGLRGVWLWPREKAEPYPAVLFANGATGTLEHNLPLAIELTKHGVACFLFDFGGQGGSRSGHEPERDLVAAIAVLRSNPRVDPDRLAAVGHSLGARLISEHSGEFRGEVLFGNLPEYDSPHILIAYSRQEFLFDPPASGNVVTGPWSDHLTGPADSVLLRSSMTWLGKRLGFEPVHQISEPSRLFARLSALLGGALIIFALLLFLPIGEPMPAGEAPIPRSFLWITSAGTMTLPVLLLRRQRPAFRLSEKPIAFAVVWGVAFFTGVYVLSACALSWSYFNVLLYPRKLWFFCVMGLIFTLIMWHDQSLLHGPLIEKPGFRWRELWNAAFAGSAGRWLVACLIFVIVVASRGRPGVWMVLSAVSFVTFWLEGFAVCLSVRIRHPLAGATFLGLTWAWLWAVFLPM